MQDWQPATSDLACVSGYVDLSLEEPVCSPAPTIMDKSGPDFRCDSVQDSCTYQSGGSTFSLPCKCGLTPTGDSFCPKIYQDTYTTLLAELSSTLPNLHSCHTLDRLDIYECLLLNIESEQDLELLNRFIIAFFEREHSNEIRGNDECMQGHSKVSQFWDAVNGQTKNQNFHREETQSFSRQLQQPKFWMLLAYLFCLFVLTYKPSKLD